MYTLADAVRLKEQVLERWEAADRDPSLVDDGALNVVVVGGGPTGVESVGALAELYRSNFAEDYPQVPQEKARLILVEAGPTLFAMFKQDIRDYTKRALEKRGVEVIVGESVASVTPTRVTLKSGKVLERAHARLGSRACRRARSRLRCRVELERGHRVPVGPDLSLEGRPEIFVVGDIAWITDTKTGEVLPQLGSVALQAGERAGENIARRLTGEETKPFVYEDKGTMATIGRGAAVVQFRRGRTMKGKAASLAWGAVHLALLSTGEDRAKAVIDWTWAGFTHERSNRITVRTDVNEKKERELSEQPADVFVIFGITGDLAKVMTFRSLYRLERRGLLDCPIVGVAVNDWTVDQLVERARESIVGTGEIARRGGVRPGWRGASRTSRAISTTPRPTSASARRSAARSFRSSISRSRRSCSAGS